jgi:radical SAM superfamily enzyme YgiQ (UPF0313 family)
MIKVALLYAPYNSERKILFSLAYVLGGLRPAVGDDVQVELFDCPGMDLDTAELYKRLDAYKPNIVGVSIPFTTMLTSSLEIIERCKQTYPGVWTVAGGTHVTLCPEDLTEVCDYVVLGEGAEPMLDIIRAYKEGTRTVKAPGVMYYENGELVKLPRIDTQKSRKELMGSPDWSDLDLTPFLGPVIFGSKDKGFSLFTSKGCPYQCSYCSNHLLWDNRVLYRPKNEILDEIKYLQSKYNIRNFVLEDDVFTVKKSRVFDFCDMIIENKLDIEWVFQTRPNIVPDEETLEICKAAGARAVNMGIESGSPEVLKANQTTSKELIVEAVQRVQSVGLKVYGGFIVGFPEDTIETVWETITFPDELDIDSPGFQNMVPYPKTAVRAKAQKEGGILTNDYSRYSTYDVVYVPPGLNGYDLKKIRKFAYQYFHTQNKDRLEKFIMRFKGTASYDDVKMAYEDAYINRDRYDIDYLRSLRYDPNAPEEATARLPI